jgi:hypothetical protein
MSRRVPRDSIQEIVARCYTAAGGVECAASDLGMSKSTLSEHAEIPRGKRAGGLGINYADTLARIHSEVATVLAQHFATLGGGTFTAFEEGPRLSVTQHISRLAKETAEGVCALNELPEGGCKAKARKELLEARQCIDDALRDLDAPQLRGVK